MWKTNRARTVRKEMTFGLSKLSGDYVEEQEEGLAAAYQEENCGKITAWMDPCPGSSG